MEYADIVWDNCSMQEKKDLDRIQDEAATIVTGATKLVSLIVLHNHDDDVCWGLLQ